MTGKWHRTNQEVNHTMAATTFSRLFCNCQDGGEELRLSKRSSEIPEQERLRSIFSESEACTIHS